MSKLRRKEPSKDGKGCITVPILLAVNALVTFAFVIADEHIMDLADKYKIISLVFGGLAIALAFWLRSYGWLALFAVFQLVSFFVFAEYLNGLPD